MELVYLWFENYKNIKKIGCSLNANYEEISSDYNTDKNSLLIKLKQQNCLNIFGQYLNIKTIVGINGSGKSNICQALVSILRANYEKDIEDYFDETTPKEYYLLYKINEKYECFTTCQNVEVLINDELLQVETKCANEWCALFKPFLNKEEDYTIAFPKEMHMNDIIKKKMENYFYYDRFRMYDTSHALRDFFNANKKLNLKILDDNNKYLTFDMYGYEIDILQEFEWLTNQIKNKIPSSIKKTNTTFNSIWDLVDRLQRSNEGIIEKAKKHEYNNKDIVFHEVFSNGCLEFVLIKMAEVFYFLEGQENIVSLKNLEEVITYLNELDFSVKHAKFKNFYEQILSEFNREIEDELIKKQLEYFNLVDIFTNLIQSCIEFESNLLCNNTFLQNILTTDDGNVYRPVRKHMVDVKNNKLTKELKILNNLGIFKQNFYNYRNNSLYTFCDLSTGEQRILRFFADILSIKNNEKTKDTAVFIFDEMDLSWHPEWQRKMVYYVIDFFNKTNNNLINNIIFTTHSPFILSDMPRNNVIMLQKENNGNTKIIPKIENTFGANIHDLFNDNFFLGDCDGICTIGEFAQNYIKDIQKSLNSYEPIFNDSICMSPTVINNNESKLYKVIEDLHKKIEFIGEPVIRNALLKKLYSSPYSWYLFEPNKLLIHYINLKEKHEKLQRIFNEKNKSE